LANLLNILKRFEPLSKIQTNSIWICFLDFYLKIHLEFELLPKRKDVPIEFIGILEIFWSFRTTLFLFCKLGSA
jgi:hypothetical protein